MSTNRKFTNKDSIEEIINFYKDGYSLNALGKMYKAAPYTIERTILNAGVPLRHKNTMRNLTQEDLEKISVLYKSGKSAPEIKKELNLVCTTGTILTAVRRQGISPRTGNKRTVKFYVNSEGYKRVVIDKGHPFYDMGQLRGAKKFDNTRTILEHRLVLAQKLDRPLLSHETVHHINGNKLDNRPENLELRIGPHGKGASGNHCDSCKCFGGKKMEEDKLGPHHLFEEKLPFSGTGYSEVNCVTAKELREMGIVIPLDIPECGWVPKKSITVSKNNLLKFSEPFKWEQEVTEKFIERRQG